MGGAVLRVQGERLFVALNGFFVLVLIQISVAEIVINRIVLRLNLGHQLEFLGRFLITLKLVKGIAERVMRIGIVRMERNRLLQGLNSLFILAALVVGLSQVEV